METTLKGINLITQDMVSIILQSGLGITLFRIFSLVRGQMCFMILRNSWFSFAVFDFTVKMDNEEIKI